MDYPFEVSVKPGTDIWRKPPTYSLENAPIYRKQDLPFVSLLSASITFSARYTCQYDQAGLAVILRHEGSLLTKWIKLGIEYFDNEPRLSVSCCDNWADWCVASLPASAWDDVTLGEKSLTFTLEKKEGALWVFFVTEEGNRISLREITWVYGLEDLQNWTAEVGAMAARPNTDAQSDLEVIFHALEITIDGK